MIGDCAFFSSGITEIVIPKNVTTIGPSAFSSCKSLTHLELHDGITSLATAWLVNECTALETIRLPKNLTEIGEYFAQGCSALKTVEFGSQVTLIGEAAFAGCSSLTAIDLPDTVSQIGSSAFSGCTGLAAVTLPDTVKLIDTKAFFKCSALRSINLPSGLEAVGSNAFAGCTSLEFTVYQGMAYLGNAENPYLLWMSRIDENRKDLVLHKDTKFIMAGVLPELDITTLTLGESIATLTVRELTTHKTLVKIYVTAGNKTYHVAGNCLIETAAKKLIKGFSDSVIPSDGSVTIIGAGAFANLTGLTSIVIPDTVEEVRDQAFLNCADLETIVFGAGVKKIGGNLLSHCEKLQAIYFNGTYDQWEAIDIAGEVQTGVFRIENRILLDTTKYFYSEDKPTEEGNFWHYVDGKP